MGERLKVTGAPGTVFPKVERAGSMTTSLKAAVAFSTVESDRFGFRIGRWTLDAPVDAIEARAAVEGYDIVILRAPAALTRLPIELASVEDYVAITADNLCYWEWRGGQPNDLDPPVGVHLVTTDSIDSIGDMVLDSFQRYPNHYATNPLLDSAKCLEGYQEWAATIMASDSTTLTFEDDTGRGLGFAMVDWGGEKPDIKLVAVRPEARGRGLHAQLISACVDAAVERGRLPILSSTQAHNTTVIRDWARLSFVPVETMATFHLIRRDLLLSAWGCQGARGTSGQK